MAWLEFFSSYYFVSFFFAWLSGSLIKAALKSYKLKKGFSFKHGFSNGGMPSTHSASVSSITTAILLTTGLSPLFYVCFVFSLIIMNDAFTVRQNVGLQGDALNKLIKGKVKNPLKVVYGHTFFQVAAGFVWGIVVAAILYILMF